MDLETGKLEEVLPQAVTRKDVSIQKPWFDIPTRCLRVKQAAPTAILTRQHVLILFLEVARARQRAVRQALVDLETVKPEEVLRGPVGHLREGKTLALTYIPSFAAKVKSLKRRIVAGVMLR